MYFINRGNLDRLLQSLSGDYRVYVPTRTGENIAFSPYSESIPDAMVIGEVRGFEPLKAFYFLGREKVAKDFNPEMPHASDTPPCIVGVKACDLKGFRVLDHVFMDEEYGDPTYMKARNEGLIISADCTTAKDTCFCTAVDGKPWPDADFDLNLSPLQDGYLVLVGSEKGKAVLQSHSELFQSPVDEMKRSVQQQRGSVKRKVEKTVAEYSLPPVERLAGSVKRNYDSNIWNEEAGTCVECGACNTICPTCHCFLLYDQRSDGSLGRFRAWDSCLINDFARVAGGENPRGSLWMRLRNRFDKKFDYFPNVMGEVACTGCGRCIAACPGKIDIRKVLGRLDSE